MPLWALSGQKSGVPVSAHRATTISRNVSGPALSFQAPVAQTADLNRLDTAPTARVEPELTAEGDPAESFP